jgi:hypothetical protein
MFVSAIFQPTVISYRQAKCFSFMCQGKVVHPRTCHEAPDVEYRYSSTLSLTSALDGVGGQRHALADLYNNNPWRNNPWGSRPTERPPPVSEASANFDG